MVRKTLNNRELERRGGRKKVRTKKPEGNIPFAEFRGEIEEIESFDFWFGLLRQMDAEKSRLAQFNDGINQPKIVVGNKLRGYLGGEDNRTMEEYLGQEDYTPFVKALYYLHRNRGITL